MKSQLKFLLNKCSWKSKSLRFLWKKLSVEWVRIGCEHTGYLFAPYRWKSNCSSLKVFRVKLTVSIYGGKVTSNPIERLHPVTYNTTLCISFPQNVRLGPYPCCEQATSDDAVKPVAFASPCFSRSDFSRLPQIGSLLELLNCRLQKSILNIFVYLFTLAKFCLQASWIQVFCTYFLVIIAVLNRFVYWWQKTVLIEESKRSCTKPFVRRKKIIQKQTISG